MEDLKNFLLIFNGAEKLQKLRKIQKNINILKAKVQAVMFWMSFDTKIAEMGQSVIEFHSIIKFEFGPVIFQPEVNYCTSATRQFKSLKSNLNIHF